MRRPASRALIAAGQFQTSVKGQPVAYTLKVSPRARRARLEFRDDAGLVIVLPRWMGREAAEELLWNHRRWVVVRLAERAERQRAAADRSVIFFLGEECALCSVESVDWSGVSLKDRRLTVAVRPGEDAAAVIEGWYREQALAVIAQRAAQFARQLGVTYRRLAVRDGRTRWGSCSPQASLSFNWKLVMAPPAVIDYVVIHELAHIRQMDHSRRFWRLVEAHCPEWRAHRRWLRDHQSALDMPLRVPAP